MPRFVILYHETPAGYPRGTHFDLMIEQGEVLRTWALEKLPAFDETVAAERLPDHRAVYLDYEGDVSGERGSVRRIDAGNFTIVSDTPDSLTIRIEGSTLRGLATLELSDESAHRWRISLSPG